MWILLFNCGKRHTKNTVIHGVTHGFPEHFWSAWLVIRCSCIRRSSCRPIFEFDFSTTRGTLRVKRTFWCSSSFVFMHTTFSMPSQVKQQSFLLNEFQIEPIYCILMTFPSIFVWNNPCLVTSHGVSPIPFSSFIGFTVLKNTACFPLLRLFPPEKPGERLWAQLRTIVPRPEAIQIMLWRWFEDCRNRTILLHTWYRRRTRDATLMPRIYNASMRKEEVKINSIISLLSLDCSDIRNYVRKC